jgi:hypothetical protein
MNDGQFLSFFKNRIDPDFLQDGSGLGGRGGKTNPGISQ